MEQNKTTKMVKVKILAGIGIVIALVVFGLVVFNSSLTEEMEAISDVELTGETKVFEITAKNWEFSPSLIEVNLGDVVELHVESIEGFHGFVISEFGVSETLEPGNDIHVEFIANKKGSFSFYCNIPCGRGHGGMGGMIVVK